MWRPTVQVFREYTYAAGKKPAPTVPFCRIRPLFCGEHLPTDRYPLPDGVRGIAKTHTMRYITSIKLPLTSLEKPCQVG